MGVVPPGKRAEKWNRRYDADRLKAIVDAEKPVFYANAVPKFESLAAMEGQVKTVLNTEGISVAQTANFLCFGREMWKLTQNYAGDTAALAAANLIAKWTARGLSPSVLEKLRSQVFNVPAPVGP